MASLADLQIKFNREFTPVRFAAYEGHIEMVRLLVEFAEATMTNDLLLYAAGGGRVEVVEMLLDNGVSDITTLPGSGGQVPALVIAAQFGYPDVVKLLLDKGSDINARVTTNSHKEPETALQVAALNGHCEIVEMLLNRGADIEAQNKSGYRALDLAMFSQSAKVSEILKRVAAERAANYSVVL